MLKGPLRVIQSSESKYTLEDLITNKEKEYHVTDIKPFHFDPLNTNPVDVARKDYSEFFIEAILKHTGTKKVNLSSTLSGWVVMMNTTPGNHTLTSET
jgi:hypothetical protein